MHTHVPRSFIPFCALCLPLNSFLLVKRGIGFLFTQTAFSLLLQRCRLRLLPALLLIINKLKSRKITVYILEISNGVRINQLCTCWDFQNDAYLIILSIVSFILDNVVNRDQYYFSSRFLIILRLNYYFLRLLERQLNKNNFQKRIIPSGGWIFLFLIII